MPQSMSKTAFLDKVGTSFNFYKFTYWLYSSKLLCICYKDVYLLFCAAIIYLGLFVHVKMICFVSSVSFVTGIRREFAAFGRQAYAFECKVTAVTMVRGPVPRDFSLKMKNCMLYFSSAWIYLKVCSIVKNSEKNLCVCITKSFYLDQPCTPQVKP